MKILGVSAFYHDSAAALIDDGQILAAAQEERFTRVKHDSSFPRNAINFCLEFTHATPEEVDLVVFYEKPFPKFERLLETYFAYAPRGFQSFAKAMPVWLTEKLFQKNNIISELKDSLSGKVNWGSRLFFSEHHLSHAASAFYPSPFESAAILTMDGVGEWPTTSIALGQGNEIRVLEEIHFPHSLGLLYSAFTYFTGFKVNSGEYKLMGLAPYGEPRYVGEIYDHLIEIRDDGSFHLNMDYFDFATGLRMTSNKFSTLFGGPPRSAEGQLTQREMDLAASIQVVTEDVVTKIARFAAQETGEANLCLAGGVALNCVANGRLVREGIFENIWIQPAAGDAGGSLGAALAVHHMMLGNPRESSPSRDNMRGSYLGTCYTQQSVEDALQNAGAVYERRTDDELISETAQALADGLAVGWFQGRMEFGPRALGSRSILADPRSDEMQRVLNLKVKFRESFRPFAPSVLEQHAAEWFNLGVTSPYMLLVADVAEEKQVPMTADEGSLFGIDKLNVPRSQIPAVTHVDYSARIQTVSRQTNARFYDLLMSFYELTGCPVLVNTSFNVRGEPIVESPSDAYRCFMGTDLDLLAIENTILHKMNQPADLRQDYRAAYELD